MMEKIANQHNYVASNFKDKFQTQSL